MHYINKDNMLSCYPLA